MQLLERVITMRGNEILIKLFLPFFSSSSSCIYSLSFTDVPCRDSFSRFGMFSSLKYFIYMMYCANG